MADSRTLAEQLRRQLADALLSCRTVHDEVTVEVPPKRLIEVCRALREDPAFAFEVLIDLCGVDYSTYGQTEWQTESTDTGFSRGVDRFSPGKAGSAGGGTRFAVVYHLLSVSQNQRLRLRTVAGDDEFPVIDSVTGVWASANWYEREAFDLYGIVFEGHPDLRRILTDYGFIGHPFRKDFPLSGHVEMRYDADKQRVVYVPIEIEPRVLVPRVIRHDHRYEGRLPEESQTDA